MPIDLTDQIIAALEAHWLHHDNRCRCDKSRKVLTGAEWRTHVAERVAEALQLKERVQNHAGVTMRSYQTPWVQVPKDLP